MKQSQEVKLAKLAIKAKKEERQLLILQQIVASPVFQMVGPVILAEVLESAGILSGRLAGAIEGGVITMVGLRALKDYGILGAATFGIGAASGGILGNILDKDSSWLNKLYGDAANLPGELAGYLGIK